ncbi:uncharacterized protein LOC116853078 isoform X1 [Odontomachus brunneus]|uniref:uncharacterized protein LOC116853078 isoform X1 n=1 Tax=Odontomachus brunneus TaxID=486640 RepID=UPI0013F1A361|nr:uncharacterized protein LOC116853078 isoform X1 [Odontomachus brunneus]
MKIIVIILSVLIAMNVVYCNLEDLQKYKRGYEACARRIGVPPNEVRIDTALCAAIANGEIAPLFERSELKYSRNTGNNSTKDTALNQKPNRINLYCKKVVNFKKHLKIKHSILKWCIQSRRSYENSSKVDSRSG